MFTSNVYNMYSKKVDEVSTGLIKDLVGNEDIDVGNEGFELLDKTLYKIDKAFENSIKGVMGFFQNTNIFIEDLMEYKTKTPSITNLHKARPTFIKVSDRIKFHSVENRKAPVILGLKLTYKELMELLAANSSYVNGLEDSMNRFINFLDSLLDSKKDELNVNVDKDEVSALASNVKNINKSLDTVTHDKLLKDRVELKRLTKNFRELNETINLTLKLGNVYRMENLERIYELNEEINSKLDLLYDIIKSKKASISKDDIKKISMYIGNMAKMLTAVAFLFYLYYQLVDMLVATIKMIEMEDEDKSITDSVASSFKEGYNILLNVFK